jgi:tRNA-splicing ligase RtcB
MEAAGKFKWRTNEKGEKEYVQVREGRISHQMMRDWISPLGVELRGAGTDESPHCYKRLPDVLRHHSNSVRALHTLTPLGVAMAGADELDPYKD